MIPAAPGILEEGWHVNGFVAIACAVEHGWMNPLLIACQESLHAGAQSSSSLCLQTYAADRGTVWGREHLIEILAEDEASRTLASHYLARVHGVLGHNSTPLSEFDFLDHLRDWVDNQYDLTSAWVTIYKHTWKIEHAYRILGLGLYAPFAVMLAEPEMAPWCLETLHNSINDIIEFGPIGLDCIRQSLSDEGAIVSTDLLHFLVLNRCDLITICLEDIVVDKIQRALPGAHLAKHLLIKEKYLSLRRNTWDTGSNPFTVDLEYDQAGLTDFFIRAGTNVGDHLCWEELATKIWNDDFCCHQVQGLPAPVEEAIVACLRRESRVLSRDDIIRLLRADRLNLDPEELGPGRILAYVPGPRFATAKTCLYVLDEWVQDAEHSRNRISPTRVITPRFSKAIAVTLSQCVDVLAQDEQFRALGVTTSRRLAFALAVRMPSRPTEPYYINKIARCVETNLRACVRSLGGSVLVDRRWEALLRTHEKPARKRALIVRTLKAIASGPIDSDRKTAAAILLRELKP